MFFNKREPSTTQEENSAIEIVTLKPSSHPTLPIEKTASNADLSTLLGFTTVPLDTPKAEETPPPAPRSFRFCNIL